MSHIKPCLLRIFYYPYRPMPLLDGRLVSYFVHKNQLCWYSFPMTTVTNVDYIQYSTKILIEQEKNCYHILFFDNAVHAKCEFKLLLSLKRQFSGKTYNCNSLPPREK